LEVEKLRTQELKTLGSTFVILGIIFGEDQLIYYFLSVLEYCCQLFYNNESFREMYLKVVTEPSDRHLRKGFIKCPECGEEILMIPTLREISTAIENHVKTHKELLMDSPLLKQQTAMHVRLDLAQQVLQQASFPQLF
jgi:hypothetical protein